MNTVSAILVLCSIWIEETVPQKDAICNATASLKFDVKWPSAANWTLSEPPCVNKAHELLYRKCSDGKWGAEPGCFYVQSPTPPQCPEGFLDSDELNMCYIISSQKSKFPPKCPFEDVLPFDFYKDAIENMGPVWMPVKRDIGNGVDFLRWTEASPLYKTYFEGDYVWKDVKYDGCLLYYNNSYVEAVCCDEEHFSACAYKKLNQLTDQLCNRKNFCHQSDFTAKSKCFCFGTSPQEESSYSKVEFLKPYQNSIYGIFTNDTCAIGLEKTANGTYIWSNSKQEINYTYWSPDVVFDDTHFYGASTPNGWILTKNPASCFLFEKEVKVSEPKLTLGLENDKFILNVTNPSGLKTIDSDLMVYCFTNAEASSLVYRYPALTQIQNNENLLVLSFSPLEDGPGHYWCESFKQLDLKLIKSNKIFLRNKEKFQFDFVAILKISNFQEINPLSKDIIKVLEEKVFHQLTTIDYMKILYTSRVMKILHLNKFNTEIYINIHLTSKGQNSEYQHDIEYQYILDLLKETFKQTEDVEIVDFLSIDFCMAETKQLNWPTTPSGTVATPEEFCFGPDGSRLTRLCKTDFVNGAQWSDVDDDCKIFNTSSVTKDLEILTNGAFDEVIENLRTISKHPSDFLPIDLYLIGEVFASLVNVTEINLSEFGEIMNNILEIDADIFMQAQFQLRASDAILDAIDQIVANNVKSIEFSSKNYHLTVATISNYSGIIVPNENHTSLRRVPPGFDTAKVHSMNPESAIWLSPQLLDQLRWDYHKLVVMVFFNDFLFQEPSTTATLGTVFRVMLPDFRDNFLAPVRILETVNGTKDCSFWGYDYYSHFHGSWIKKSEAVNSSYLLCEFWDTDYFALTSTSEDIRYDNVTDSLLAVLESNRPAPEVIGKLRNISVSYNKFTSIDVCLTSKILQKVNQGKEVDLEALAETINNLHLIDKPILQESQFEEAATDSILHHIDEILKSHHYQTPIEIKRDNFMIFIYNIKETNFSGVALFERNQTFEIEILREHEIEEVAGFADLTSAVVLSSALKNQLQEGEVVVTIFTNDALFDQQKRQYRNVSNIFGVLLPEVVEFSGPISVLHKVAQNNYQCVYWSYNTTSAGFWLGNQEHKQLSSVVDCEFWHTTHFTLLLLDENDFDDEILDWITTINCAMSVFGLICIIFTAILFKKWRRNTGNLILLNFAFAMALQIGLFYISNTVNQNSDDHFLCTTIGVLLHYCVLSEFSWMFIIAILQYKRFVDVLGPPPTFILLKACLIGWVFPLLPVITVLILDGQSYVNSKTGLCYPTDLGLYLGVWFPVCAVVLINSVIFVYIICSVVCKKTECTNIGTSEAIFQWRLAILLFFMLGLTWIFGFLSDFSEVFLYLFCATGTLQGFVMFLFFIVFNANTRNLYWQACRKRCVTC